MAGLVGVLWMNVLFYVEPLIERGLPYWKDGWALYWGKSMISRLANENCYIAMSDAVAEKYSSEYGERIVVFSQEELLKPFDGGYMEASSVWYLHSYTKNQLEYYVQLMKSKFAGIAFDVIITWTQVPFFKAAYPDVCILHMEYSIFSRLPFPETMYLDPCGLYENNFLNKFEQQIRLIKLEDNAKQWLSKLRQACVESFNNNNIFIADFLKLRKKYRFLVLLPLQFSQYYAFDCLSNYKNQFDFLVGCLEKIPNDIGVVFTMHPEYPVLDEAAVLYVVKKYSNAVFLENSRKIYSASQWMMPLVDGVITVSSSLGVQTLLFEKKLFAIGNKNMRYIADSSDLNNMHDVLERPMSNKDVFLWFIITRYAIPEEFLFKGDWLSAFLHRSRSRAVNENFYDCIGENSEIFAKHIKSIVFNRNRIPQWVKENAIIDNNSIPRMYIFSNSQYTEEYSVLPETFCVNDVMEVTFSLKHRAVEGRVRFDPIEGEFCRFRFIGLKADVELEKYEIIYDGMSEQQGDWIVFFSKDPIVEFIGKFSSVSEITIQYMLEIVDADVPIRSFFQKIIDGRNEVALLKQRLDDTLEELLCIKASRGYRYGKKVEKILEYLT